MFSNTAYEALYEYLGLELHARFIEVLTSQRIFWAALVLIFGVMFFMTSARFLSRYLPGSIIQRRPVPLSRFFHLALSLVIGIAVLRAGGETGVNHFDGTPWDQNPYIKAQGKDIQPSYRVSFVFALLSRSAEEVAALLSRVVDDLFKVNHSQLEAPDFFYKAVMYAGTATIADPGLKDAARFYTEECLTRALPLVADKDGLKRLDGMIGEGKEVDRTLETLQVGDDRDGTTCLDVKNDVRDRLMAYTRATAKDFPPTLNKYVGYPLDEPTWMNLRASMALVDQYMDQHEGALGIQKGAQPQSGAARVFQYLGRFFSWDGLTSLVGGREGHGAALAAERSQEFSENLSRAPHVAGFIKMVLIGIFPWLVFPVVAGKWRILLHWYLLYFSVLLWAPIWTLLYHVMVGVSLSAETLKAFGQLSDGLSLYSATLVTTRMNYMFAVYSWLQLVIATAFTGGMLMMLRPVIGDTEKDQTPEFVKDAKDVATGGAKAASAIL